ncbi:helix-turn-helix domain-containing protein [Muriventricola aceti]|uniref:helix-turn-helix domain-containing protein n=1 Tax=Muriventricola aceti TaxID=2981773 RepID=UPI003EBB3590
MIHSSTEHIPDILTISDLQQFLQISRSTAYRLIREKKIGHIRIGNSIRIPRKYVAEYLQQGLVPVEDSNERCYNSNKESVGNASLSEEGVQYDR